MNNPIDIKIKLSLKDALSVSAHTYFRNPFSFFFTMGGLLLFIYHMLHLTGYTETIGEVSIGATFFWSFALFGLPLITYLMTKYNHENNENFKGEILYRIDENWIQIYAAKNFERVDWDKLLRIRETKHTILFFISHNGAHILPKRFMSKEELNAVRQIIKSKNNPNFKVKKLTP